ncbi:MatE family protein [Tritrichomonas foetus]|uniref:MatE family protein n=1 Tax=Tritrichomonas foetus TaxID=1144522 RepID=A0A1J4JLS4_9EUKA|nr:MatE family protein [Tritrichomonas foetus]|eukprot:OHS99641.1 MatE family protein [Tritrichomonas foetus]
MYVFSNIQLLFQLLRFIAINYDHFIFSLKSTLVYMVKQTSIEPAPLLEQTQSEERNDTTNGNRFHDPENLASRTDNTHDILDTPHQSVPDNNNFQILDKKEEKNNVDNNNSLNNTTDGSNCTNKNTANNKDHKISEKDSENLQEKEDKVEEFDEEDEEVKKNTEEYRLGGKTPLMTILTLMIGPLLSQIMQSMYGLMDTFWISKTIGAKGLTTMSLISAIDFVDIAICQFLSVAMSTRISYLIGSRQKEKCGQVVVDLFRLEIIIGAIVPIILIPCVKPMIRWYGGDEEVVKMSMEYLLPTLCCSFIKYTYLSLCGLLQAMGNSLVFGMAQVVSALLNMLVFDPLFLYGFKTGMVGVSFATVLSNLVPFIVLYIMLFAGKFCVKPSFKMYITKFSGHSFDALKVSTSQLIANLAVSIPDLILAKLVGQSAKEINTYDETMAAWNIIERLDEFAMCVCHGLNQGFLPAASYAFGRGDMPRLSKMAIITTIIGTIWTSSCCIIITSMPRIIASIWGSDEKFLDIAEKVLILCFASCFLNQIILTTTATLQAMKNVTLSIITSVLTMMIPVPLFGFILYMTNKKDPIRLIFAYICQDVWSITVVLIIIFWKLRFIFTSVKDPNKGKKKGAEKIEGNSIKPPESETDTKINRHNAITQGTSEIEYSDYYSGSEESLSNPLVENIEKG